MTLDLYGKYELAPENQDIYEFLQKHGCLFYELAEQLEMSREELYLWFGEPLSNDEKQIIVKAAKRIFDRSCAIMREHIMDAEERRLQRQHDLAKYGKSSHCTLFEGRKYTGQFRNYEGPGNQWDA